MLNLAYNEDSPSGLIWLEARGNRAAGSPAGTKEPSGYWRVSKTDRTLVHRIIWEMLKGSVPDGHVVDHINGDRADNRIDNLRCILYELNAQNRAMQHDNTSGLTGVHYSAKDDRWIASWYVEGKRRTKSFSVARFGGSAKVFAGQYRSLKIDELNENGSSYTSRHGT